MRHLTKTNATMDDIIAAIPLPEVERLVHELYKPNPPETITRIQEILQSVQKSSRGWELAHGLLSQSDENVKFFGALTFTVKLNTESLSDEDAVSVLQKLISFLTTRLRDGTAPFVIKKLCSALVTYFIHYSHTWPKCVRHLSYCLQNRASIPVNGDNDLPSAFEEAIQSMDAESYYALTWFASFLANEAEKLDNKSTKFIPLHERLMENATDVVVFLAPGINPANERNTRPHDSIDCLQAWLQYAQRNPRQAVIQRFQTLVHPVINCLPNDEAYDLAVELLTNTLEDWPAFFLRDHFESLYSVFESQWGQDKYQLLVEGEDIDDDEVQYGLFMLAFGNAQVVELMDGTNERAQQFLASLIGLLRAKGYPGVENKIFVPALEFWSSYVENLVDTLFTESPRVVQWDKPPIWQILQAVSEASQKIRYPHISIYNAWDSTERVAFADARKDVADFLQAVHTIIGNQLIAIFAEKLLEALSRSAWAELEATAYCLGGLSDCISDENSCDDVLTKVFGSHLFELLRQGQNVVPVRARQTCLSLIERYSDYFSNHAEFLPAALNLLFSAVGDRHLTLPSSKSIFTLCSSCRSLLTPEVDAFLEQYGSLRSNNLDSLAEERVVGAIAAIIQAVPEEARKASAFQRLLTMVGADVEISLQLSSQPEGFLIPANNAAIIRAFDLPPGVAQSVSASDVSLLLAIRALRCLCSMAKGLQAPSEALVDLEADDESVQTVASTNMNQIQVDIMNILVRIKDTFSSNSEVVDVISSIIRAGFSETEPGPFVFPAQMVTVFITSRWHSRIATIVNTASVFVTSLNSGSQKKYIGEVLGRLLPWLFGLLHQLSELMWFKPLLALLIYGIADSNAEPEEDPELAQYGLEFTQRVMSKRPDILMAQPPNMLEFLFMFALKLLNGNEPLPKQAAADFWTTFISLKTDDQNAQAIIDNAMTYLGPKLSESLIQNIGGKASRSELDKLSEPLKKLVTQHVNARQWLQAALQDPAFPSDLVSAEDKELFLKKIIMLRGQRPTNQAVRNFWLACRGSSFAYAS